MAKPKMVLFDAGRTLLDYAEIDTLKGVRAYMPYITSNPKQLTAQEIDRRTNEIFDQFEACRKQLFEVPECTVLALVRDLLQLEFSIGVKEQERIIWNADAVKVPTPHVQEVLDELNRQGIRTAVISNLDFSGELLRDTLNEKFPRNRFEFVIASSDYGVRKPRPEIFKAGIERSGLKPEEIWYVGDKIPVDIEGSAAVGMIPVLYRCPRNRYDSIPEQLRVADDFMDILAMINNEVE